MKNGTINPCDGELTFIGKVLGSLPVDVHLGKLLVLAYVFGCLEECLVISKFNSWADQVCASTLILSSLVHMFVVFQYNKLFILNNFLLFSLSLRCFTVFAILFCISF